MARKLTRLEFQRRAKEVLARMRAEARPFEDDSEEGKRARRERGRRDKLWFFKTYLTHYFYLPFGDFHKELLVLLDIQDEPVFAALPREFGKSAICSLGIQVHDICYGTHHFEIIGSDTEDQAASFTGFIKLEIEENDRIKQDFGELKGPFSKWADNDFVTRNGVRVLARGRGQRIRGLRWRQYRPDRIMIDDLENDKNVRNPRIVKEGVDWIKGAVLGSLAVGGNLMMVGNLFNKRCVLAQFIYEKDDQGKPQYISRIFRAIKDDGTALWPQNWPLDRLAKRKAAMGSVVFNREMMNDPRDEEGLFREEWFRYYLPTEIAGKQLAVFSFIDASVGAGESADYKALVTVGQDGEGILYVLDAFIRKCSIDQLLRVAYSRYDEFHAQLIGVEDNAFQKLLLRDFDILAQEKKYYLPIRGVTHNVAKESRIARLSPLVERGIIRFQKGQGDQDLLIEQLLYFPSTTVNDDGPDALEGAVALAERPSALVVAL